MSKKLPRHRSRAPLASASRPSPAAIAPGPSEPLRRAPEPERGSLTGRLPEHALQAWDELQRAFRHESLRLVPMMRDGRILLTIGPAGKAEGGMLAYSPLVAILSPALRAELQPASEADLQAAGLLPSD